MQFYQENNLIATNTWFKLPKRRLYTWKSPQDKKENIVRNQVDYITINSRFRNSVLNAEAYPGFDIDSNPNPVAISMKIKLKKVEKPKAKNKIDWASTEEDKKKRYKQHVAVQLEIKLQTDQHNYNIERAWIDFKKAIAGAGEGMIAKKHHRKRNPWMTNTILNLMA